MPDAVHTGNGGAVTMESGRSNTLRGFQHSPKKSVSPVKNQLTAEDRDRGRFRKKAAGNFRANSEPPNEIGLYNIHS